MFYAVPMFCFDNFSTDTAKANANARECWKKMMDVNSDLYMQLNEVVIIHFLSVYAPK